MRSFEIIHLPSLSLYQETIAKMESMAEDLIAGTGGQKILLLEHSPVYTIGISSKPEHIKEDFKEIPVVKTNRGGKATYHGPGQRVAYVITDLKKLLDKNIPDIRLYVSLLEKWIINTLSHFNISAYILPGLIGVWVTNPASGKQEKIAAIGVRVRKGVAFHGVAINIDPDLKLFTKGIVPCGIEDYGVCSIKSLTGTSLSLKDFDRVLLEEFEGVFSIK